MRENTLTPEEVSEFEARAASGEMPVFEWKGNDIELPFPLSDIRIYECYDFYQGHHVWRLRRRAFTGFVGGDFKSAIAATLYAESLIRTATLPLHQKGNENA